MLSNSIKQLIIKLIIRPLQHTDGLTITGLVNSIKVVKQMTGKSEQSVYKLMTKIYGRVTRNRNRG